MNRMLRNTVIMIVAVGLLYAGHWIYETSFRDARYLSGWVLMTAMTFLVLFNIRKKLSMLPLGRASIWMQFHIYLGYFVVLGFALHTGFSMPDSTLEWALWGLFVMVALSGIVGTILVKTIPPKLERHSEKVLFQRIPSYRAQLAREAETLAMNSVDQVASLTISNLHTNLLHDFFRRPRNIVSHLASSQRPLNRIFGEMDKLERYLDETGRTMLAAIRDLVVAKDNLDFHYANQGLLKTWLFLHIPATYGLVVLVLAHVAIMYAFTSGVP